MEVKTQEIIRYIDLRFKEQDLKELRNEMLSLEEWFKNNPYSSNREVFAKYVKIIEFKDVVLYAIDDIRS